MKLTLINPWWNKNKPQHSKVQQLLQSKYPPLGIAFLAGALERLGHEVQIIDAEAEELDDADIAGRIETFGADLIGITSTTWTLAGLRETAAYLKKTFPKTEIIIGGPHVGEFPGQTLEMEEFDYGVIGEGEKVIENFLRAYEGNKDFSGVRGLVYRKDGKIVVNEREAALTDIDFNPAWHLFPIEKYTHVMARKKRFATMFSSRGCPYRCTFCDANSRIGKEIRFRSPENLLAEVDTLYNTYGVREICFYDDTLTLDRNRIKRFCELLIERKYDLIWECRTRVDCINEELMKVMARAGCYRIRFGVEAGNETILNVLKKDITLDQARTAFRLAKKYKIETVAYFMLGSPSETEGTMQDTIDFSMEIEPDYVLFSPTRLMHKGTQMHRWAVENGYISRDHWERFIRGEDVDPIPILETETLKKEMITRYVRKAYRSFYFRPKYLFRTARRINSWADLKITTLIGLNFLSSSFDG